MIVSKTAVAEFVKRKLNDYSFLKECTRGELVSAVRELTDGTGFKFKTKPFTHQLAGFYAGACNDVFMYQFDMGLGKTKTVSDVLTYRHLQNEVNRTLVVVPSSVNIEGWEEEIGTHSDLEVVPMYGSTADRWRLLNESGDLFVINYAGLLYMACDLEENKKGKRKMRVKPKYLRQLVKAFDSVVFDELHLAKNNQSVTFRMLDRLSRKWPIRYGLTGTPFGRDPIDLWAQSYLIDRGATLGDNVGIFRQAFFKQEEGYSGFPKWVFDTSKWKLLHRMMQNIALRYEDEEVQDLPPLIEKVVHFGLARDAREHYANALENVQLSARGGLESIKGAYSRMRMLCSGYLQLKDADDTKHVVAFNNPPKIEALRQILMELPKDRKMVIWHEHRYTAIMIEKLLTEMKLPFSSVRGQKDNLTAVERFKYRDARILVANYASGATGGNFQVANYAVFYELTDDPIKFKQAWKRTYRTGQTRHTFMYMFITKCHGSVEEKILGFLKEGKSLFDAIVEGKVKW